MIKAAKATDRICKETLWEYADSDVRAAADWARFMQLNVSDEIIV